MQIRGKNKISKYLIKTRGDCPPPPFIAPVKVMQGVPCAYLEGPLEIAVDPPPLPPPLIFVNPSLRSFYLWFWSTNNRYQTWGHFWKKNIKIVSSFERIIFAISISLECLRVKIQVSKSFILIYSRLYICKHISYFISLQHTTKHNIQTKQTSFK